MSSRIQKLSENNLKFVRLNLEFSNSKTSNPKFVRNLELEIIFIKVKMENCPIESGI